MSNQPQHKFVILCLSQFLFSVPLPKMHLPSKNLYFGILPSLWWVFQVCSWLKVLTCQSCYEDQGYQLHILVLSCWWKPAHHPSSHCWVWWAYFQHQLCLKMSHLGAAGSLPSDCSSRPKCVVPTACGTRQCREWEWLELHHWVQPAACAERLSHYFISRAHNYFNVGLGCKNKNIHKSIWNYFIKY